MIRCRRTLLPGLAALLAAAVAQAGTRDDDAHGHARVRLSERVHVLAQPERFRVQPLGNVTLVEQQDGVLVVDAGGTPKAGRDVVAAVKALGPKPVKAVVITHWHGDHVLGLGEIVRSFPHARVIATKATDEALGDGLRPYEDRAKLATSLAQVQAAHRKQAGNDTLTLLEREGFERSAKEIGAYAAQFDGPGWVRPTDLVEERLEIADPRTPVVVHHLGEGNTPGDLVVWLPAQRILVAGDVLVRPIPFAFDVHPRRWAHVLRTLAGWRPDVVVPGHGAPGPLAEEMKTLAAWLCAADAQARGLSKPSPSPEAVDLQEQVEALAGNDPWLRRWALDYWAGPLASSALRRRDEPGPACPSAPLR